MRWRVVLIFLCLLTLCRVTSASAQIDYIYGQLAHPCTNLKSFVTGAINECIDPTTNAQYYYNGSWIQLQAGPVGPTGPAGPAGPNANLSAYQGPVSITGNQTNGADQISGINVNGQVNCKTYGAIGNNSADDTPAAQTCINAAETSGYPVYMPHGTYATTFPIVITSGFLNLTGDPNAATQIQAKGNFPVLILEPSNAITNLGTLAASALTGSGQALNFNSGHPHYLNITEMTSTSKLAGGIKPLDGQANLTVQFFFTTPAAGATDEQLMTGSTTGSTGAMNLEFTVGSGITSSLVIGGVNKTVAASGTVNANTTYWVALVLDHTNSKECIFLAAPGSTNNSAVGSVATGGGNITETVHEPLVFGGLPSQWPTQGLFHPFIGTVQSLDIESSAVYSCNSSTVTAPSANFAGGANTIYLNNFTTIAPTKNGVSNTPVLSVDYLNGAAQSDAWQTIRNVTYLGNAQGPIIKGLRLVFGTEGIFWAQMPQTTLRDMSGFQASYAGIESFNNTFNSLLENISINNVGVAGLLCGWGMGQINQLTVDGGAYQMAESGLSCGEFYFPIFDGEGGGAVTTISNIYANYGANTVERDTFNGLQSDNESGGNINVFEVAGGGGFATFVGGILQPTGTGVPILVDSGVSPTLTFTGTRITPSASSAFDIDFAGNCGGAITLNGVSETGTVALTNCTSVVNQSGCGGRVALSTGSGTLTNACISTGSICSAVDTTTFANAVTLAAPANGSIALSGGTGSDVIKVDCR